MTDRRGNPTYIPDEDNPEPVKAAFIPQRSSRAEVPGQQEIEVYRMIVDPEHGKDMSLWARVDWNGDSWDIQSPPLYHHGTRATRHWSVDIRKRP